MQDNFDLVLEESFLCPAIRTFLHESCWSRFKISWWKVKHTTVLYSIFHRKLYFNHSGMQGCKNITHKRPFRLNISSFYILIILMEGLKVLKVFLGNFLFKKVMPTLRYHWHHWISYDTAETEQFSIMTFGSL